MQDIKSVIPARPESFFRTTPCPPLLRGTTEGFPTSGNDNIIEIQAEIQEFFLLDKPAMEPFISNVTEEEIRKEKTAAQKLRKSQWWKRKCAEGICYFCRKKLHPKELTMEHVVPIIRGGKSFKGNVVPACKECNNKKKYLLPIEWEEYLRTLEKEAWS